MVLGVLNNTLTAGLRRALTAAAFIMLPKESSPGSPPAGRPIAMGETICKVAAAVALARVKSAVSSIFGDVQFGAMRAQGVERIVLQTRRDFRARTDCALLTLDVKNAFNAVHRDKVLSALADYGLTDLYGISHFLYDVPSDLIWDVSDGLVSSQGVRQGDPLGPILFSLAIQPALDALKKTHGKVVIRAYLDDVSALGPPRELCAFFRDYEKRMASLGCIVHPKKCILSTHQDIHAMPFGASGVIRCHGGQKLLGAYVAATDEAESEWLVGKVSRMTSFLDRLLHLDRQCAVPLLRGCGIPRWTHYVRCHDPEASAEANGRVDYGVGKCVAGLLGVSEDQVFSLFGNPFFTKDFLGTLPFALVAPLAYKACHDGVFGTPGAQDQHTLVDREYGKLLNRWEQDALGSATARVHRASLSCPGNRLWVNCHPNRPEYCMRAQEWETAMRLRYLLPPCGGDLISCSCGQRCRAEEFAIHALDCNKVTGYTWASRHAHVKQVFKAVLRQYGFQITRNPASATEWGPTCASKWGPRWCSWM
jgi:hypothetical protein